MDRRIAHYRLLECLGAGGMGEVYRAEDTRLERIVALKCLAEREGTTPETRQLLLVEARAAAAVHHPSIATVFEVGEDAGIPYLALEYVDGETLAEAIAAGPLRLELALEVAARAVEALGAIHSRDLVHADATSSNVMLTREGGVKLLDFGLSGMVSRGSVAGTAAYMSPEQVRGETLDARTDLFSLGVVLYEMVAGRRPFEGESRAATLSAVLRAEPPLAGAARDDVPLELEGIIRRALEKDRAVRYQSADEMLADVERLRDRLAAQEAGAEPVAGPAELVVPAAARVKSVAFSPDGRQVASAGDDNTIALFDVRSRTLVRHIGMHTAPVLSVAFSPDGQHLVSGEHDRSVRMYTRRRSLWGYEFSFLQ